MTSGYLIRGAIVLIAHRIVIAPIRVRILSGRMHMSIPYRIVVDTGVALDFCRVPISLEQARLALHAYTQPRQQICILLRHEAVV